MEDCLTPELLDAHVTLRQRLPWQNLATGEHWYTPTPFSWAAAHQVVDVLQPDLQWVGGLTACVKICHIAEAAGIAVIPHAAMNDPFGQHAAFGMPNIPMGECFMASPAGVPLEEAPNLPGTLTPRDGAISVPDGPGFGLRIDREWLEAAAA
jgi:L-rhamnonate dehydratase